MSKEHLFSRVEQLLEKERKRNYIGIIICILFGIGFAFLPFVAKDSEDQFAIMVTLLAIFCGGALICALWLMLSARKLNPESSPFLTSLRNGNEDGYIVWMYFEELRNRTNTHFSIIAKTIDKKTYRFNVPETEYQPLLNSFHDTIPNCVYGFSYEKKTAYNKNPKSFYQEWQSK